MARKRCCAETWLFKDLRKTFGQSYGVELFTDLDYKVALAQSNPYHKVLHFVASNTPDISALGGCIFRGCGVNQIGIYHDRQHEAGYSGSKSRCCAISILSTAGMARTTDK